MTVWHAFALLVALDVVTLVVISKMAVDREGDQKRIRRLELLTRKLAEDDEETSVWGMKGMPEIPKFPWRIRLQWWRERMAERWRRLLNL